MAELKNTIVNGVLNVNGDAIASKIIKRGGTSSQILMADGSVVEKTAVGSITGVTAGKGLTGGGSSGTVTLNVGAGNGITVNDDTVVAKAGNGITVNSTGINHYTPTNVATDITEADRTYVKSLTFDDYGHVTGYTTGTESNQDLSNYVTLNTAQTITGVKTFTAQPVINTTNGLKFDSGNCKLRIYNTSASPTDYAVIEVRSNSASTNRNLFIDLNNNSLVVGAASGTADTTYKVNVKDTFNATTIYENGTLLSNKYAAKGHNHDGVYLSKTTYEWNKEYAAGSNGAVSLGRYNLYDTQLTFDITTTTSITISGKLVIAAQNGNILKATVYGDASNTLAGYLTIYQSAISNSRSWIEVFCNFPGWSKNKVHIYGVALNSPTVSNQMTSVTFTNGIPSGVTSGDTKWTGAIVNDITAHDAGYSGIGTCTTAATTAAKVVTLPRFALVTNATILVRVSTTNSATSGVTLNVNSTGAKSIYIGGSAWSTSNQLNAGDYLATYDGTYWKLTRIYLTDSNTNYGADRGISLVSDNFGHSNTAIDAVTTKGLYKISYDTYGHITGTEGFTLPTKDSWNYDDTYVKYSAAQSLTDAQKTQARSNIGAGTSSFSGSYNDLNNKPAIPNPADYYWANIKVSSSSNTATTPSVQKLGITGSTTTTASAAVTMEYDSTYKALKFVFN